MICYSNVTPTGGTQLVWQAWNSAPTTGTTIVQPTVWRIWNNSATTITSTNTVWLTWIIPANGTALTVPQQLRPAAPRHVVQPTTEELQALERACEERLRQEAARQAAKERAMELLRSHLRPEQLETIDKNGWFVVEGGQSKKQYRIKTNHYAGNIFELRDDKEVASYCVHAKHDIPLGDHLLGQMISLRFDEEHIIRTANKRDLVA